MAEMALRLYITGLSPDSDRILEKLHEICRACVAQYTIEVIDVLENLRLAEMDKVVATPMVIRVSPLPERRLIGDLADFDAAVLGLSLGTASEPPDLEEVGYDNQT